MLETKTHDILKQVSCATLTTALMKRGLRNVFMQNVHPLATGRPNMVGPAYTLRYIPAREDLNDLSVFNNPKHPQRAAIESCPVGHVFVIDSRMDPRAASAGDILVTRLMVRGGAGIVTDGGFRDSPSIAKMEMRAYHQRAAAPTNLVLHQAIESNVPIGCGGVPVFPNDIIVGDDEGVVVIPHEMADDIATEAHNMTLFENFVAQRVQAGQSIIGLYPPTDPANLDAFEAWKAQR